MEPLSEPERSTGLCLDTTDRTGERGCVRVRGDVDSDGVTVLVKAHQAACRMTRRGYGSPVPGGRSGGLTPRRAGSPPSS